MAKNRHADLYDVESYEPKRLALMFRTLSDYALAIGGLPQNADAALQKRGWLLPYLFAYDSLLWNRWQYWLDICHKGTIEGSGPIPKIQWSDSGTVGVKHTETMLQKCLDTPFWNHNTLDDFADWLLWGFAATKVPPNISKELNQHFYKNFDLFLVLKFPTDYLSYVLCNETSRGYKSSLGYFPTPFNVARAMTEITVSGMAAEELKKKTVYDPAIGCGATLLPISNYCLRAYGTDISHIAVKLCKIQMYWYAPWFAFHPAHIKGFDGNQFELQTV